MRLLSDGDDGRVAIIAIWRWLQSLQAWAHHQRAGCGGNALADVAKEPISALWKVAKTLPADNKEAGLPEAEKIVSNFISAVEVQNGVINMTFGNKAHPQIKGKSFHSDLRWLKNRNRACSWVCGNAKAPDKMKLIGENKTNVADDYLPHLCR